MNPNEHIEVEDLALFALLLLGDREAELVRVHEQGCSLCREELRRVREDLAMFALTVEPAAIPQGARDRFMARLDGTRAGSDAPRQLQESSHGGPAPGQSGAGRPSLVPARSSAARVLPFTSWVGWIGWAAAAAAVVAAVGLKQDRDSLRAALVTQTQQTARLQADAERARHILGALTDPSAVRVNLTVPKAAATPSARATYEQGTGTLLLTAGNLSPLQSQKVYELWLIPADGSKPVPAGTFSPDAHGNANLLVPALRGAVAAKAFGITVEQAGGSVTPTMPILLAGAPA